MPVSLGLRHTLHQDLVIPLPGFHCTCHLGLSHSEVRLAVGYYVGLPMGAGDFEWAVRLLGCQGAKFPGIRLF